MAGGTAGRSIRTPDDRLILPVDPRRAVVRRADASAELTGSLKVDPACGSAGAAAASDEHHHRDGKRDNGRTPGRGSPASGRADVPRPLDFSRHCRGDTSSCHATECCRLRVHHRPKRVSPLGWRLNAVQGEFCPAAAIALFCRNGASFVHPARKFLRLRHWIRSGGDAV